MAKPKQPKPVSAATSSSSSEEDETPSEVVADARPPPTSVKDAVPVQEWEYMYPVALLSIAAAGSAISQSTSAPVYGSIPSAVNHATMCSISLLLGFTVRTFTNSLTHARVLGPLAVWVFWMPFLHTRISLFSGTLGPVTGPILNGFLSCHTILVPTGFVVADFISRYKQTAFLASKVGVTAADTMIGVFLAFAMYPVLQEKWTGIVQWLPVAFKDKFELNPLHLQMALGVSYALLAPSWYVFYGLPALAHTFFLNKHMTVERADASLATYNWTLLDRQWSNTGYISVLESKEDNYRVLRADHSLLGGEWLLTASRKSKEGWQVNESVYAVFQMLESVRLLQLDSVPVPDTSAKALVIGLGIGTAPKAFLAHGIDTTIVELDHVVHRFATEYFGLPTNHTAILRDAVVWVKQQATRSSSPLPETEGETPPAKEEEDSTEAKKEKLEFDYIIHDVFTGGAEPLELFNTAFLRNLRTLLKPNGAIAINYAGDLSLPLTRLVLRTIEHTFDGQCKIYRDGPPETEHHNANAKEEENTRKDGDGTSDFLNMVVFCRNSPGAISFRQPTSEDFLGSLSRKHYMLPKPELEIAFPEQSSIDGGSNGTDLLERGGEISWASEQAESARRHWRIMRKVMPDAVWELW